jgi:uncharacterized membrane protein
MVKNKIKLILFGLAILLVPFISNAQEIYEDLQGVIMSRVVEIVEEGERQIPGTDARTKFQVLKVEIIEGERKGEILEIENDFILLKEGQKFYMNYLITIQGDEIYSVRDIDRRATLIFLTTLFAAIVLYFGRWQGMRSLLSLVGSFLIIIYVLLPLLMKGYDPVLVSIFLGSIILGIAIFFTHGFNFKSLIAFSGTVISVCITGLLALFSVKVLNLSGFFSDETVYLNFSTQGSLDFQGLLLGGIIIGVLGVLDDIATTQVAVVAELKKAADHITSKDLYRQALNVGNEHISALVNTLVLAYAGVSLPLLLWFSQSESEFGKIINNEIFATEIARTLVGSIGLILTVPITTFLAVKFVDKYKHLKSHRDHHHHHHG